jgi:prepilin-type N-terminal cleavage/methylation domain-containing protein
MRSQRGFTIMEVIVTILIMAGIMVSISQILTAVRNTRDRIHNMQEAHLAGPAILDRIETDLRALDDFDREPALALRVTNRVIQGLDADSIDFVATTNSAIIEKQSGADRFVRADLNEVGYRLRANPLQDDFLELWRREDFGVDEEPFDGGNFSFLHERVKGFNIEVFEEDGPEAEPFESWGTKDDEHSGIPARIEIEITVELAPRLVRETLIPTKREVTFRRIYRFPSPCASRRRSSPCPSSRACPRPRRRWMIPRPPGPCRAATASRAVGTAAAPRPWTWAAAGTAAPARAAGAAASRRSPGAAN